MSTRVRVVGYGLVIGAMALGLAACGGGSSSPSASGYHAASGVAQKGPLKQGSTVTAQELDSSLSPTGQQYTYQVTSDLGTFSPTSSFGSQFIGLTATGYYFDEVANSISGSTITLNGVSDLTTDSVLNVNLLTTLAYQRIRNLVVNSHMTVAAARQQAESEVLAALNIRGLSGYGSFGALDLSKGTDGDKALAAVSSLFVYGHTSGQLSALIASFQSDIADNGVIDTAATKSALASAGKSLSPSAVAAHLTAEYSSLGVSYTAQDISNWIDRDGDGLIGKYKFVVGNPTPSTPYTSTPYVVTAADNGATYTITAGTLLMNGVPSGTSAVVTTGDSVTITLTSGAGVASPVSTYLNKGSVHVAKFTVGSVTGLAMLAGSTTTGTGDGQGAAAGFHRTNGMVMDAQGNIYVADEFNYTVRKIAPDGTVTTLAGSAGQSGYADLQGANARFGPLNGIALDALGNLYVGDPVNNAVREIDSAGNVTTFVTGAGANPQGFDASQNLYLIDNVNCVINKVDASKTVTKIAGNGCGSTDGNAATGQFAFAAQMVLDGSGNMYIADLTNDTIRKITAAGDISTIAGTAGTVGSTDGQGTNALFNGPQGIALDGAGNLYVSDSSNETLRKIVPDGTVTTVAGQVGTSGFTAGTFTLLDAPEALLLSGNMLFVGMKAGVSVLDIRNLP